MDGKVNTSTNSVATIAHYVKQRKEVKRYFERRRNRELKKSAAMRDNQLFLFADETNKAITNGVNSNSSYTNPDVVEASVKSACINNNMLEQNQSQLQEQLQETKNKKSNVPKTESNSLQEQKLESTSSEKVNTITNNVKGDMYSTEIKAIENSSNSNSINHKANTTKTKKPKKKKSTATKDNSCLEDINLNKNDDDAHNNNSLLPCETTKQAVEQSKTINMAHKELPVKLIENGTASCSTKSDCFSKSNLVSHNKYIIDKQLICYHNDENSTSVNDFNEVEQKPCTKAVNNLHESQHEEEEKLSACMTVATCPQECERACCSFTMPNSDSPKPTLISILPILEAMHNAHCGKTSSCTSTTRTTSASGKCASTHVEKNNGPTSSSCESSSSSTFSTSQSSSSSSSSEAPASFVSSSPTAMECHAKYKCTNSNNSNDNSKDACKSENTIGFSLLTSSSSYSYSSSSRSCEESSSLQTPTFTNYNNIIVTTTEGSNSDEHITFKKDRNSSESSSLLVSRKTKASSPVRVISVDDNATQRTHLQEDQTHRTQEKDKHSEFNNINNNKYPNQSPCIVTSMVRRLDQVPPLPITRPLSSGTSLNVPTRNYLLLDKEYNLHQFAPGFKRNDELALESLLETASMEWHKIQMHSCEALLDSSTNVECDMCNRMNNSFVITTANAMKALFQVGYMAHKKMALKVIRIGPDIVIDTCAASCYGDHRSVYDLRRQALIGKALYRLREESSKVFDHSEDHLDKEPKDHQDNVGSSSNHNNSNVNGHNERSTTKVNTCRDIIPLSRQASLNFLPDNSNVNNTNSSVNTNCTVRANPLSSALVAHKREYSRFSQVMYWNIDALELLVGVDVPIILDVRTNTEHLLQLIDEADQAENSLRSEQLYCDALNCWFDATIANVPEVGVYIHNAGVIQRFELKKVNELLSRVQGKVAAMSMNFTSNVLQWIVSQCVEDKATYIVVRGDESAYLKMYKIPAEELNNVDCSSSSSTRTNESATTETKVPTPTAERSSFNKEKEQEQQSNYVDKEKQESTEIRWKEKELQTEDMVCDKNIHKEFACSNKQNECEYDKMSGVVCLYNKKLPFYTENVQGNVICMKNKNEEEERQRAERKKCMDAEEAHKERLSVSLAQMCYAMGVHLHSEADKRKANEAIGLLRRTFLIHVRRIHDNRAMEMVMDVVQRLPSLIGLMLSTMWSDNETTNSVNDNNSKNGRSTLANKIANLHINNNNNNVMNNNNNNNKSSSSYKNEEIKEVGLHQCDKEIKPFDRHVHSWATWTCVEALKLCVQFQEPLLKAIRQTEKCTSSFKFYATCLIECSAALSVLVARTLEAFCAERKCIFAAEFAAAKETRWKRQRKEKEQQHQSNNKSEQMQPLQNAIVVNDNKTPLRGEDALRPFLATIVEGLVLLEHVNHTIEELSHSTTVNVDNTNNPTIQENNNTQGDVIKATSHEINVKEVKEQVEDAKLVKSEEKTKMKSISYNNEGINNKETVEEGSCNIELAPLRAALCELYGDLVLLTMADPTTFTSLILKRIATEMTVQLSNCNWNTDSSGANKGNDITSKNTTLQWLRCISSDAVSLSFTALRFYTKSSTTAQRQLLKTGQVHYFVGQFHHRVDRYTKSLEALHRAKSIFALAAKTNKVPPFGECFCSAELVTVEDVMEALGDVYADLAELKEHVALNMFTHQNKRNSGNSNSSVYIVYTIYTNAYNTNSINNMIHNLSNHHQQEDVYSSNGVVINNKSLSSNAYVAFQPILLGPLHVMCEEEENFLRRAINAYTSSTCLSAKSHVLIKYANAQIGNLALRSMSTNSLSSLSPSFVEEEEQKAALFTANAMKLVPIDKTESKHIYYLLQEAKNVNVSVLEWQRQWELMRLFEVTKTGECEDHLFTEVEEIVKEWISLYIVTSTSESEKLSDKNDCRNNLDVKDMNSDIQTNEVYTHINKKSKDKQEMELKTIELDHITNIEQLLQLSVTCIRIAEEYKYSMQVKRLSNKHTCVEDARNKLREMQSHHQRMQCIHWTRQAMCILSKLLDDALGINHNKLTKLKVVKDDSQAEQRSNNVGKDNETNKNWTVWLSSWMRVWRFAFSTINTIHKSSNKNVTCNGVINGSIDKVEESNQEMSSQTIVNESNSESSQMTCTNSTVIENNNHKRKNNNNDIEFYDLQQWCYFVCVIVCRVLQCINDDTLEIKSEVKISDNGSTQNNTANNTTTEIMKTMKSAKRLDALAEVVQELLTRRENMTKTTLIELLCTLRTQLKTNLVDFNNKLSK